MPLESTHQVGCNGCGAKLDVHAGLRTRTFVCDYCGAVNEGKEVLAVQEVQTLRERYRPSSPLKLGLTATLLGHEYQIIGRIRAEEESWHWDEWFLWSTNGFPLWLQEGEDGFVIWRVFYPTVPVNPWLAQGWVKLDDAGTKAKIRERGIGTIAFLEGELTWSARPGERFNYLDCARGETRYSVEYTENEIQYLRGETRSQRQIWDAFGLRGDASPAQPTPAAGGDDWEQTVAADAAAEKARARTAKRGRRLLLALAVAASAALLVFSTCGQTNGKLVRSYSLKARAATGSDDGVLLTDEHGRPVSVTLPRGLGAYELRLASSAVSGGGGLSGGHCWWTEVEFLKERPKQELAAIQKELKEEEETLDEWARFQVVHKVEADFGAYWGIDEGERWSEQETVHQHFFRTKDPGPYYLRVYADNCEDYASRQANPVLHATLTVALYRNVWMIRWPLGIAIALLSLLSLLWMGKKWKWF
jgi:hypothetical protein